MGEEIAAETVRPPGAATRRARRRVLTAATTTITVAAVDAWASPRTSVSVAAAAATAVATFTLVTHPAVVRARQWRQLAVVATDVADRRGVPAASTLAARAGGDPRKLAQLDTSLTALERIYGDRERVAAAA